MAEPRPSTSSFESSLPGDLEKFDLRLARERSPNLVPSRLLHRKFVRSSLTGVSAKSPHPAPSTKARTDQRPSDTSTGPAAGCVRDLFEPRLLQPYHPNRAWKNKERQTHSVKLLKKPRQSHPNDYWVFPSARKPGAHLGSVRKAHDRVCEAMGLRGAMDLYNLRHTFATRSILSGTDVTILRKILGTWKSE